MDHGSFSVIWHKDSCDTAKIIIHVDMCSNPGIQLFIDKCLYIWILAIGHDSYNEKNIYDFSGIGINDVGWVSSPVNHKPVRPVYG